MGFPAKAELSRYNGSIYRIVGVAYMTWAPHDSIVLFDFSLTEKAAPHECVIRTGQP